MDVTFNHPNLRKVINRIEKGNFANGRLGSVLLGENGIRYGIGSPPPIVPPSEDSVPFIRATNIKEGEILTDDLLYVSKVQDKAMEKCLVVAGEMILVRSGVNAGDCAIVPDQLSQSYAAYDLVLNFGKTVIPQYIAEFLDTSSGRAQLNVMRGRAAQPHLNAEEISSIIIPIPHPTIQQAFVSELQAARESRKHKLTQADALLASIDEFVLNELKIPSPQTDKRQLFAVRLNDLMRGRLDTNYHQPYFAHLTNALDQSPFPKVSVGALSPDIASGATPTRGDAELYANDGIKFLRIMNIAPNEIDLADIKYIKPNVHTKDLQRSQLQAQDVLMTITGRVGTATVVTSKILPANINQHIVRLRIQDNGCLPEYFALYLNTSFGNALTNRGVTGGTRIALDYEAVRRIQIPLPPIEIQRRIIQKMQERREQANKLRAQAEQEWQAAKKRFEEQLLGE